MNERRLSPTEIGDYWRLNRERWLARDLELSKVDNEPRIGGVTDPNVPSIKIKRGQPSLVPMREGAERMARKRRK